MGTAQSEKKNKNKKKQKESQPLIFQVCLYSLPQVFNDRNDN